MKCVDGEQFSAEILKLIRGESKGEQCRGRVK